MGHEITQRRDETVGVHDLDGVDAADVAIDQVVARNRELPEAGLPSGRAVGIAGKNPALVKERSGISRIPSKKSPDAAHRIGDIRRKRIGGRGAGISCRTLIVAIHDKDLRRRNVAAVVPHVGDDHASQRAGKIHADATGSVISCVQPHGSRVRGCLSRGRVGRFARRHRHDLLAHDHEAIIHDPHHHDQEDGKNDGELDERLALALAPPGTHG